MLDRLFSFEGVIALSTLIGPLFLVWITWTEPRE